MGAISAAAARLGRGTRRPRFVSPFLIGARKVRNRAEGRKKLPGQMECALHFLILILILISFFQSVIKLD
jgi:hypothetical protein